LDFHKARRPWWWVGHLLSLVYASRRWHGW